MKNAFVFATAILLSGCGAGHEPIPEKFDLSNVLWKWTATQAQCEHMTEVGSGLTTGMPDTVRHIKKAKLELTLDSLAFIDYVAYSDTACTLPIGGFRENYNLQEWVTPSSSSESNRIGAFLIYLGRDNQEGAAASLGYSMPILVKALFVTNNGKLDMYEDTSTDPSLLDAEGYPTGASEPIATFVRP